MTIQIYSLMTVASFTMLLAQSAHAATLTVTNTGDGGPGSLRQAILEANASSGADGIIFDLGPGPHTISLVEWLPPLSTDLDLRGPGADLLTIEAVGDFAVFFAGQESSEGPPNTVSFAGMTIANGSSPWNGGGIWGYLCEINVRECAFVGNQAELGGGAIGAFGAPLTVENCSFFGNSAGSEGGAISVYDTDSAVVSNCTFVGNAARFGGAMYSAYGAGSGLLVVESCTIRSNQAVAGGGIYSLASIRNSIVTDNNASAGGGIYVSGTQATIESCVLKNNAANTGGGIDNSGTLNVANSTISGNLATNSGGGIHNSGRFGGNLKVSNCTLSGNGADVGGGIYNFGEDAVVALHNCTLSGNGARVAGGIFNDGYVGIARLSSTNSILALNAGGDIVHERSTVDIANYNLIGDRDGDPRLGPLADNGGPTMTMALLPGSPCIDAGDPNFVPPPEFDQRGSGFARVVNGRIDIGAFEVQPPEDSDGDGILDTVDQCPNTPAGDIVNASGCSIGQLVPCAGPRSGGSWKNHGQYVSTVVETAKEFLNAHLIDHRQWSQIVTDAAQSKCGGKGDAR